MVLSPGEIPGEAKSSDMHFFVESPSHYNRSLVFSHLSHMVGEGYGEEARSNRTAAESSIWVEIIRCVNILSNIWREG